MDIVYTVAGTVLMIAGLFLLYIGYVTRETSHDMDIHNPDNPYHEYFPDRIHPD